MSLLDATMLMLDLTLGPAPTVDEQLDALEHEREELLLDIDAGDRALKERIPEKFRKAIIALQATRRLDLARIDRTLQLYGRGAG